MEYFHSDAMDVVASTIRRSLMDDAQMMMIEQQEMLQQANATTTSASMYSWDYYHDQNGEIISLGQYVGLVLACTFGCILGCFGSCTILYCSRYKLSNLYHRTLALLAIFDFANSITWMLHPFVFNAKGTPGLYWATGNFKTCAAGGFLGVAFSIPMWIYSFYLGVYFVLIIRYRCPDRIIARYLELPAFLIAIFIGGAMGVWGIMAQTFNPGPNELLCLSQTYPDECGVDSSVECIRGTNDTNFGLIFVFLSCFCALGGIITTTLVYCSVWKVVKKHRTSHRFSSLDGMEQQLQSVAKQCILYFLVYGNVFLWPLVTNLVYGLTMSDGSKASRTSLLSYMFNVMSWFFFPITGLFNCMVYLRPRYVVWRSYNPNLGIIWAVKKAIGSDPLPKVSSSKPLTQRGARRVASSAHIDDDLRGVSKAFELYELREFNSSLDVWGKESGDKEQVGAPNLNNVDAKGETTTHRKVDQEEEIVAESHVPNSVDDGIGDDQKEEVIVFVGDGDDDDSAGSLEFGLTCDDSSFRVKTETEKSFDIIIK